MDKNDLLEVISQLNPQYPVSLSNQNVQYIANPHSIAHCLAQIKEEGPSYYGRYKYAGQETWAKDAAIRLSMDLIDKTKYKTPKGFEGRNMLLRICQAAIWEHCGNELCPSCNGRGSFQNGNLLVTCLTCDGFRTVSASSGRHKAFDMDVWEWRSWEGLYLKALEILDTYERKVLSALKRDFGGEFVKHFSVIR